MKFTCLKENLIKGLNVVSRISSKNISLPILNNILVSTTSEGIELTGTNLEIGVKVRIRGKSDEKGQTTVPARVLTSFINYLPEDKIEFELKEADLNIACQKWKTKLKTQPAEDYPLIPEVENKSSFKIKAHKFAQALNQTIFAAVNNESRPELSGGYFVFKDNILTMVATDSYRLAERKVEIESDIKSEKKIIVPIKTLQELLKVLQDSEGEKNVEVCFEENQIKFVVENVEITSRLIDGEYPDYKQIIPDGFKTRVKFNKKQVINAVKASSLFSKSGINDVSFKCSEPDKFIINSVNNQVGENTIEIDSEVNGEEVTIVFNHHYVSEGMMNMNENKLVFELNGGTSPAILKAEDGEDYLYLVMPIRQ